MSDGAPARNDAAALPGHGLVRSIGTVAAAALTGVSSSLRLLLVIAIEVFLMTSVILLPLTRVLARWIHPRQVRA